MTGIHSKQEKLPFLTAASKPKPAADGITIRTVAEDILQETPGRQAHINEITSAAISTHRNLGLSADEFKKKLSSALAAAVKVRSGAVFTKVGVTNKSTGKTTYKKGIYKLKNAKQQIPLAQPASETNKNYFGKAGEFAVISELLFWGVNVSPMIVDQGVDLVAEKNNKYFYIQVKTASGQEGSWKFTIKKSSFDASHSNLMYYIFVMRTSASSREASKNLFVVVPSTHMDTLIKSRSIVGENAYSVTISTPDRGKSWKLNRTECNVFMNAFNHFA